MLRSDLYDSLYAVFCAITMRI